MYIKRATSLHKGIKTFFLLHKVLRSSLYCIHRVRPSNYIREQFLKSQAIPIFIKTSQNIVKKKNQKTMLKNLFFTYSMFGLSRLTGLKLKGLSKLNWTDTEAIRKHCNKKIKISGTMLHIW